MGVANSATHDITPSVYGEDDALCTVRLNAAFVVDGSTFGQRSPKSVPTAIRRTAPVAAKAQPSRPFAFAQSAPRRTTAASAAVTSVAARPESTWVMIRNV